MEHYLCIHCHFYQPPRENPWLGAVELQDSATPYHDWNERVTAECYLPNGASRILDQQGRIAKIVNNYARISFNFGPTLLSWMEENAPHAYQRILDADQQSQELHSGHGAALAQAYNHLILPLANRRDKFTQILWGIRDFQYRFKRDPEGMWLPETAVDLETLDCLRQLGIKFTVLAPHQVRRTRNAPWEEWRNVEGSRIDPTRAYYCYLPSGHTISLFFYDGPISHAVAFENLLTDGERFARRLLDGFNDGRPWDQLVHIATDGETYGHHHAHGDMALAYALDYIESRRLARITNYGEYLANCPPSAEAEIVEQSSWSCLHGVARWHFDCGCNSGACNGWNQQWRHPLRQAMDRLRDDLATVFERTGQDLFCDVWAARDDYIRVVLDRSPAPADAFFALHAVRELSLAERVQALRLLEMQRHLMLMYTSCGWFFDELSGPECVQVLQYAGRAMQLAAKACGENPEESFLCNLEKAWSNIASFGNGRHVYERFVRPAMLDLLGVGAHFAISAIFDGYRDSAYCYRVDLDESHLLESGKTKLAMGRARVHSSITGAELPIAFAALHFGDHNLSAGVRECQDESSFRMLVEEASQAFSHADLPECLRAIDRHFGKATYSLKSLFRDAQRRIVGEILDATIRDAGAMYREMYEQHAPLICFLSELGIPAPPILRSTAEFVLAETVRQVLSDPEVDLDRVRRLLQAARDDGIALDTPGLEHALRQRLNALVEQWAQNPRNSEALEMIEALVSLARVPPFEVDLWKSQNVYYELLQEVSRAPRLRASRGWLNHFFGLGKWLGIVVPDRSLESGAAPPEEPRRLVSRSA